LAGESLAEAIQRLGRNGGLQDELAQPDARLLERFARRCDGPAFTALVARHGPMVFGLCRRLLPDVRDAEDAFQAAFLVLARKASALPTRTALGPWLYGVAWRVALRLRGRGMRRRALERTGVDLQAVPADDPAWSEARSVVQEEVRRLPEKYRSVVVLCCLEEKSNEEAAALLRRPVGTVKSRLARARDILRSRLTRRGLALSVGLLAAALAVRPTQAAAAAAVRRPSPPPEDAGARRTPPPVGTVVRAAVRFAPGGKNAAGMTGRPAELARGVLRATTVSKLMAAAVGALTIIAIAALVVVLVRMGRPPGAAGARPDAEAIQGEWQVTDFDQSGLIEPLGDDLVRAIMEQKWRFDPDAMVIQDKGIEHNPVPYTLDPNGRPKAIDVAWAGGGDVCKSVYELNGDELTIHLGNPVTGVRPDDLTPRRGDGTMRFTFRREK
jgi:RNA polymerase sigma factor (sigma-70 family)